MRLSEDKEVNGTIINNIMTFLKEINLLKGTASLIINMFYQKELYEP